MRSLIAIIHAIIIICVHAICGWFSVETKNEWNLALDICKCQSIIFFFVEKKLRIDQYIYKAICNKLIILVVSC